MLHPDSHNMFENGSFLRRRRRFKQESANNHHRHQSRQKGNQNSPNLISPTNPPETRPAGTKASRSRNQMEKDTTPDGTDALQSPKKVGQKRVFFFHIKFSYQTFCRNMPPNVSHQKWNQLKPVNQVIIYQHILIYRHPKPHHHHQ